MAWTASSLGPNGFSFPLSLAGVVTRPGIGGGQLSCPGAALRREPVGREGESDTDCSAGCNLLPPPDPLSSCSRWPGCVPWSRGEGEAPSSMHSGSNSHSASASLIYPMMMMIDQGLYGGTQVGKIF